MAGQSENKGKKSPNKWNSFFRYHASAFAATVCDFGTTVFLTEIFGVWYTYSTAIGAFAGAFVAFTLGRAWVFVAFDGKRPNQAFRYVIVALGSMALNTLGVYLLTENTGISYVISKSIVAVFIGATYNFNLSRNFVFK